MIKRLAYLVLLLISAPQLSSAKINDRFNVVSDKLGINLSFKQFIVDTTLNKKIKKQELAEKNRIKEIAKAKRQPKPEKIDLNNAEDIKVKQKLKRQRRPEGLERPPEIPRRNGN